MVYTLLAQMVWYILHWVGCPLCDESGGTNNVKHSGCLQYKEYRMVLQQYWHALQLVAGSGQIWPKQFGNVRGM